MGVSEASKLTISNNMPHTSCMRYLPPQSTSATSSSSHHNPFINAPTTATTGYASSKQARPVLRPSLSHNGVFHHPSAYPRAMPPSKSTTPAIPSQSLATGAAAAAHSAGETPRPVTAGTILDHASTTPLPPVSGADLSTSAPGSTFRFSAAPPPPSSTVHPVASQEVSSAVPAHPFFAAHSQTAATATPPVSATIPAYTQHPPQPINIQHTTPTYADEHSFSTSYSYDTSFSSTSSGSPWMGQHAAPRPPPPPLVPSQYYPHPHALYEMYGPTKQVEPILAPGEIPAPRPPMSYAALIGEALLLAPPPHHLYVSEISESIKKRYACE